VENYYLEGNPDLIFSEDFTSPFFLRDRDDVTIVGSPQLYKTNKKKFTRFTPSDKLLVDIPINSGNFGGISFYVTNAKEDSLLIKTDNSYFPIKLKSSEYSSCVQLHIGDNLINFYKECSQTGINHVAINFSGKYECFVNSSLADIKVLSGINDGSFPYTGINEIFPSFSGGVSDLIILNRNFEGSEATGFYTRKIWKYNDEINSFYDFSSNPLIDTLSNSYLSSGSNFSIVDGSRSGYFAFRFPQSTGVSINNNSIFTGNFSIVSLVKHSGDLNYSLFDKCDNNTGIFLGISGNKFFAVLSDGEFKKEIYSLNDLSENTWNYINFSYGDKNPSLYINQSHVPLATLQNDDINFIYNTGPINISKPNSYFTNFLSGDIDELRIY